MDSNISPPRRPAEDEDDITRNGAQAVDHETVTDPDDNKYKKETRKLPGWSSLLVLAVLVSVFTVVWVLDSRLPRALTVADIPDQPEAFIEERARKTLQALTSIGARPSGSYENEVLAVELLKRELHSIQQRTSASNKLSIDIQVVTAKTRKNLSDGKSWSTFRNREGVSTYSSLTD